MDENKTKTSLLTATKQSMSTVEFAVYSTSAHLTVAWHMRLTFPWSRRFIVRGLSCSCSLPVVKVFILYYIRQIRTGGTTFYLGGPVKSVAYAAPA